MTLHEGDVLAPLDPSIRGDTDQWPEFALNHVKVFSQATREPLSLLAAHAGCFVVVEGILEEVDRENALLLKPIAYRNRIVTVDSVATYSFSLFDDGSFGFWAAGKAGWFELRSPAKDFKRVFAAMQEATGMFYYLADKYRNRHTSLLNLPAKKLEIHVKRQFNDASLPKYPKSKYCQDQDYLGDMRESFYNHREFLMRSMLEGQEGLDWRNAPVLRHLKSTFPQDFAAFDNLVSMSKPTMDTQLLERQMLSPQDVTKSPAKGKRQETASKVKVVDLAENEENDSVYPSNPHKRKSVLRPKSDKASKKFIGSRQSVRSGTRNEVHQGDDLERLGSNECVEQASVVERSNGNGQGFPFDMTDVAILKAQVPRTSPKTSIWSTIAGEILPSYYEPRGYGDVWSCPYDACVHRVYDARHSASVDLIKEHFVKTHAGNAQHLIAQESRPWVSVDHLLERVRGIASLQAQVTPQRAGLPSRVIRRY